MIYKKQKFAQNKIDEIKDFSIPSIF